MSDMNASEIWTGKANILHKYKTGLDDIINDESKKKPQFGLRSNICKNFGSFFSNTISRSPFKY